MCSLHVVARSVARSVARGAEGALDQPMRKLLHRLAKSPYLASLCLCNYCAPKFRAKVLLRSSLFLLELYSEY